MTMKDFDVLRTFVNRFRLWQPKEQAHLESLVV